MCDLTDTEIIEYFTGEDKFAKSNFLIGAKFKSTLMENKLMAMSLSKVDEAYENSEGSLIVSIKASDVKKALGVSSGNFYSQLEKTASRMSGRVIGMSNPEKEEFHYATVVTNCSYKDGFFKIEFNRTLNKYLKDLQTNFTRLSLETMLNFKSVYAFRLYEILKSKMYMPKGMVNKDNKYCINFDIYELKFELGVYNAETGRAKNILNESKVPDYKRAEEVAEEKMFTKWAELKRRVIDVAVAELNTQTELDVDYDPVKSGKGGKVIGINFYVKTKDVINPSQDMEETQKSALSDEDKDNILDDVLKLIKEDIRIRDAKAIAEAGEYDLSRIKEKYQLSQTKDIKDIVGWMIIALRKDFSEPIPGKKKPQYSSFEHREDKDLDYDSLLSN